MIGTNWDITSRKNAEQALFESKEDLQKTNAEKDKFFSIIAHDLRGPFNGFLGMTKLLADELPNLAQGEIQKMAGAMRDSATNLFRLLENLLEWSRLQRGITSFEPGQFILMPMIAESMRPVIDLADKKGVEIRYEIQTDLEVFADEYMLASTIRNLASNAVKFTTKGGKVTIAAKTIPGNSVEISFMDTGIGMNSKTVADLFRIDVQTNRKGTENEPSSGLGLLLCKDFVEKHGGKLWVESEEGKGSVFYFTIPDNAKGLMKNVITNSVSNEEKEVQIKRMKILIAEDDEISASLISAMVEKYSHQVLHAKTGVDAVHACRNNPDIDLVLMDINLTGMDGFEATRQIRQFNNDVVIIAQTAFSLKFDRVMAIEAGCNDYINKPISNSELQGLIRKYFTE
jgi:CheY-like chemotaxis protein